jgi:hypothetical protein
MDYMVSYLWNPKRRITTMSGSSDLLVDVVMQEREYQARKAAAVSALLRGARPERDRRHSLRERLGFSLIQAGRALLRHGSTYAAARRRLA